MARDFSKNTANYMAIGINKVSPLVNGAALISLHARVTFDALGAGANLDRILQVALANGATGLLIGTGQVSSNQKLRIGARSVSTDTFRTADSTTTLSTGVSHSLGGVVNIAGDAIRVYLNGVQEASTAATFGNATYTNGTPTTSYDMIGSDASPPGGTTTQVDGSIAEWAIWNGDIATAGFAQLAKGWSPLQVRPELLVCYFTLDGRVSPEVDMIAGLTGTITGTVAQRAHPRVFYPGGIISARKTTVVTGKPWLHYARQMSA